MEKLKYFVFNNILPATFRQSYTYIEQIRILKNKLNEVIEVVNMQSEEINRLNEIINNQTGGGSV